VTGFKALENLSDSELEEIRLACMASREITLADQGDWTDTRWVAEKRAVVSILHGQAVLIQLLDELVALEKHARRLR